MPLAFTLMNMSNTVAVGTSAGVIHSLYPASTRGWESLPLPQLSEAYLQAWRQTWTKYLKCFWALSKTRGKKKIKKIQSRPTMKQGLPLWERALKWYHVILPVHRKAYKASFIFSHALSPIPELHVVDDGFKAVCILIAEVVWAGEFVL